MRTYSLAALGAVVSVLVTGAACGSKGGDSGFGDLGDSGAGSGSGGGSGGSSGGSGGGSGSGSLVGDGGSSGGEAGGPCNPNPANYDIPGNGCDDDGDGKVDNVTVCDQSLTLTGAAQDFASAMGLCQNATGPKWGIVSATYTQGYSAGAPNDGQHGILPGFGSVIMPREGTKLGVLSSGYAREWDNTGGTSGSCSPPGGKGKGAPCFKGEQTPMGDGKPISGGAPSGYPKAAAGCAVDANVFDAIGVTLKIKVPANAKGFQFDFDFYSGEWPEYVCTHFNDSFIAWLQSAAFSGTGGDLNISYDAKNNPVSVNNAFFDQCTMGASTGCCAKPGTGPEFCGTPTGTAACAGGPNELASTGFLDDGTYCGGPSSGGGATGWLTTTAPVKPGETMTVQFIIWDTGDFNFDSSVLLDNFKWQPVPTMTGTTRPPMAQ